MSFNRFLKSMTETKPCESSFSYTLYSLSYWRNWFSRIAPRSSRDLSWLLILSLLICCCEIKWFFSNWRVLIFTVDFSFSSLRWFPSYRFRLKVSPALNPSRLKLGTFTAFKPALAKAFSCGLYFSSLMDWSAIIPRLSNLYEIRNCESERLWVLIANLVPEYLQRTNL